MKFKTIDTTTEDSALKDIKTIAKQLLGQTLSIGESTYQMTEIEFYVTSKLDEHFSDRYTHCHPLQLQTGKLYAHASGIDITLGNDKLYAGVLLRGVAKLRDKNSPKTDLQEADHYNFEKIIAGPQNVATELLSNLSFDDNNRISLSDFDQKSYDKFALIAETTRQGLTKHEDKYFNFDLRFIGFYPLEVVKAVNSKNITLANRVNIVTDEINKRENKDLNLVRSILGYVPAALK